MTLGKVERRIFSVSLASPNCGAPAVRRLTATLITLSVDISTGSFVDAFHNKETGTTAFAPGREGRCVFGADNTGGRHVHPTADPNSHIPFLRGLSMG